MPAAKDEMRSCKDKPTATVPADKIEAKLERFTFKIQSTKNASAKFNKTLNSDKVNVLTETSTVSLLLTPNVFSKNIHDQLYKQSTYDDDNNRNDDSG